MLIVFVIASAIILALALVVSIPVSYACRIVGTAPVRITGRLAWGGNLASVVWDYRYGDKPVLTLSAFGQTKTKRAVPDEELTDADIERAAQAIEDEGNSPSYDDVARAETPVDNTASKPKSSWKRLVFTSDFLAAFFTYIGRLAYHSRLRHIRFTGRLGLGQPHTTGMAAGALYALFPTGTEELSFNYLEEDYDCTVTVRGHMYPIVYLYETARFAVTKPVRQVLSYWRKGGEAHG